MAAVSAIEEGSGVKEGSPGEDAIGLGVHQSRFNGGDIHFFLFLILILIFSLKEWEFNFPSREERKMEGKRGIKKSLAVPGATLALRRLLSEPFFVLLQRGSESTRTRPAQSPFFFFIN